MLTPNYLMNVAEPLVELWSQLECDIIADIARRLVKNAGEMTETARWQILKAREMGILQTDLAAEIAKTAKISKKQAKQLVIEACKESLIIDDYKYIKAGYAPLPLAQSEALMEVVNAGAMKTNNLMTNFTKTTADTATKAFEHCLDRAYMQINSGAFSFDSAIQSIIRDLSSKGIERIVYPSGSSIRMDAAARRALVTGINQTAAQVQLALDRRALALVHNVAVDVRDLRQPRDNARPVRDHRPHSDPHSHPDPDAHADADGHEHNHNLPRLCHHE